MKSATITAAALVGSTARAPAIPAPAGRRGAILHHGDAEKEFFGAATNNRMEILAAFKGFFEALTRACAVEVVTDFDICATARRAGSRDGRRAARER